MPDVEFKRHAAAVAARPELAAAEHRRQWRDGRRQRRQRQWLRRSGRDRFACACRWRTTRVNPLADATAQGVIALLVSDTPGVQVRQPLGAVRAHRPGETQANVLSYSAAVVAELRSRHADRAEARRRSGDSAAADCDLATLRHTLFTGTPVATTLLSENFDAGAWGTLPAGWTSVARRRRERRAVGHQQHVLRQQQCGVPSERERQRRGDPTRWERLFSPNFAVPADSDYVTLDFDVCTDTEDDPNFQIQAFDGLTLRIFDATPGTTARSVLVEALRGRAHHERLQALPEASAAQQQSRVSAGHVGVGGRLAGRAARPHATCPAWRARSRNCGSSTRRTGAQPAWMSAAGRSAACRSTIWSCAACRQRRAGTCGWQLVRG